MTAYFGTVGHGLVQGSSNYYECVSVVGTTYLYKRPSKPSNHGSEIKFVADSSTGSGRFTGIWQDASTVNFPNAFQDPALHPTTSGTPSYTPTHNDTTLYLYNNENHDATVTVDYSQASSGSGTGSSGGVSVFDAEFYPNTRTVLRGVITRQGPAQYEGGTSSISLFDENVYLNNPLYTTNWPTGGTVTTQTFSSLSNFTLDHTKTYYIASPQGVIYATSTPESRRTKKVFCNFW